VVRGDAQIHTIITSLIRSFLMSGLKDVIQQLEHQKAAIEKALDALRGLEATPESQPRRGPGRPPKAEAPQHGMSEAGRQRLREAMKRRWAAKRAGTTAKQASAKKGGMTAAGRQRLAEAMRKRWAVKRAASAVKKSPGAKKGTAKKTPRRAT
jgi:hypothetical protein